MCSFQRRVKADLNIVTDKYRTVESIMTSNNSTKRPVDTSFDDDLLMMPVDAYMAEIRARDIVKEEQIERESKMTKPFKTSAQLRRGASTRVMACHPLAHCPASCCAQCLRGQSR